MKLKEIKQMSGIQPNNIQKQLRLIRFSKMYLIPLILNKEMWSNPILN